MLLDKLIKYFFIYSIVMFIYTAFTDTPLGERYTMVCLEPGCVIFGHKNNIYGNVEKFSISKEYIIGKVSKPNKWMIKIIKKKIIKENPKGYFIIDKFKHTSKLKMTKEEFQKECKTLNIDCTLKYSAPFWVVYDPYYWYVILVNKFD